MRRRFPSIELVLFLVVVFSHVFVVFAPAQSLMNWFRTDDAFYYFKTAQNISEGHGISFDGLARASGFHPLWMAVCIPIFSLARFDLILPLRLVALVLILLNAGTGVLLYRWLKRGLSAPVALAAAAAWVFLPPINNITTQGGLESGLNAFCMVLLFEQMTKSVEGDAVLPSRRLFVLGGLALLTVFSRLDNIFLVAGVGLWLALRKPSIGGLVLADTLLLALAGFAAFMLRLGGLSNTYYDYLPALLVLIPAGVGGLILLFYLFGLYRQPWTNSLWQTLLRMGAAVAVGGLGLLVLLEICARLDIIPGYPRTAVLLYAVIAGGLCLLPRLWAWRTARRAQLPQTPAWNPLADLRQNAPGWLRAGLAFFMPLALGLIVYMGLNYAYFGVFTPISGQMKHWWGSIYTIYGARPDTLVGLAGLADLGRGPWALLTALFDLAAGSLRELLGRPADSISYLPTILILFTALLAVLALWPERRRVVQNLRRLGWVPLMWAGLALVLYYNGSGYVNTRKWYWICQMLASLVLLAVLAEGLLQRLYRAGMPERWSRVLSAAAGLTCLVIFIFSTVKLVPLTQPPGAELRYLSDTRRLEALTAPGAIIGMTGGGEVAYFLRDRTVFNLDGLMNSVEYFKSLREKTAGVYLERLGLDYVYGKEYVLTQSEPYMWFLSGRLREIEHIGEMELYTFIR